jgi:hypothetical protein
VVLPWEVSPAWPGPSSWLLHLRCPHPQEAELLQKQLAPGHPPLPQQVAHLGMGWDVGTTGTNLGQLAICSWTFRQEEMCTLIFARVT